MIGIKMMVHENEDTVYYLTYGEDMIVNISGDFLSNFEIIINETSTKATVEFINGTIMKDVPVTFGSM